MPKMIYLERVLFIIGTRNSGKSTPLRSLFLDHRFGTAGKVPITNKVPSRIPLSNERWLYLRVSSPHEAQETPRRFHNKVRAGFDRPGRWNFACPLHPTPLYRMPDMVTVIRDFQRTFSPERIRLAFLSPNRTGDDLPQQMNWSKPRVDRWLSRLNANPGVECVFLDARHPTAAQARRHNRNGLSLSDFFDFT